MKSISGEVGSRGSRWTLRSISDDLAASEESVGICDGGCIPGGQLIDWQIIWGHFLPTCGTEISTTTSRLPA
jgi:hypothetical protein